MKDSQKLLISLLACAIGIYIIGLFYKPDNTVHYCIKGHWEYTNTSGLSTSKSLATSSRQDSVFICDQRN